MTQHEMVLGTDGHANYLLLARRNGVDISVKPFGLKEKQTGSGEYRTVLGIKLRIAWTPSDVKPTQAVVSLADVKPVENLADALPDIKWDIVRAESRSTVLGIVVKGGRITPAETLTLITSLEELDLGEKVANYLTDLLSPGSMVLSRDDLAAWFRDFFLKESMALRQKLAYSQQLGKDLEEGVGTIGLYSELLSKAYHKSKQVGSDVKEDADDDFDDEDDEDTPDED